MMHPSLPKGLTPEILANWISQNAKEKFSEEKKYYYTEEELQDFKNRAVNCGIEINSLTKLKKRIARLIDKGNLEYVQVDLLETTGIKSLKTQRENIEEEVERGYNIETIRIYGIPNSDTQMMDFFDIEGNEVAERSRSLSAKEIREYIGQFALPFPEQKQA